MKKKVLFLVLASFILSGCGISGISQDEYNKVVEERDELQEKYDDLLDGYAEMKAEQTIDQIQEDVEYQNSAETENPDNSVVVHEDDNVKMSFAGIGEDGVEFWLENRTDLNLTVQADSVSVNGISTSDIVMSDDVAPQSTGKVVAKCDDFSEDMEVENVGGQFSIVDFSRTWDPYYYEVTFANVSVK